MNNRDYKHFAPNTFWHIYNRGNGKQDIFLDDADYKFMLLRLKENLFPALSPLMAVFKGAKEDGHQGLKNNGASVPAKSHTPYARKVLASDSFQMLCYCLMPNHFHFLIKQNSDVGVDKLMTKVCTGYAKYFNKKYERIGHVFQDKFKAVLVNGDEQLLWLSAYIHNNPKTAGLTQSLKDYLWSSYLDYVGQRKGTLCDKQLILGMFNNNTSEYEKFVAGSSEKIK